MAFVSPCIKGKMGSTDYYLSKMNARELISGVRPASELDEWANMGIEERMQREPALKRIKDEIAPYVAKAKDRFFGSIIVLVYKGDVYFESLTDFKANVPRAYRSQSEDMGFLTVDGGSLIVLDGQHRLLALEAVIKKEVAGDYALDVPGDEISVIFIHHESDEKTRRIFNKLNRYAKPTSRGDNIITSEDDGYAIVTRMLLRDGASLGMRDAKGESLVNYTSNTLAARSTKLTTLGTVYETVRIALQNEPGMPSFDEKLNIVRPPDEDLDRAFEVADRYWSAVLSGLKPYQEATANVSRLPEMRAEGAPSSLLFKPVAQAALFQGLAFAKRRGLELDEAVRRANEVSWSMTDEMWKNIIVSPNGNIMAHNDARDRASELIAYLIGRDKMTKEQIEALQKIYSEESGEDKELPQPVPDAQ